MSVFERFLTLWVALCIIAGIALGQLMPGVFHAIGNATIAQVNLPVALLVWLMIVPMLLKIDPRALSEVGQHWRGIAATVGVNWLIKPFSMALLAWIFVAHLFHPFLPADQISSYTAGLILLAAAPCTAMVFVWSNLVDGEPHFTLSQVALNDTIMLVAFAPIVALLLGLSSITVPWNTLILSVVVSVIIALLWRHALLAQGGLPALNRTLRPASWWRCRSCCPSCISSAAHAVGTRPDSAHPGTLVANSAFDVFFTMLYRTIMVRPEGRQSGWARTEESDMREEEARFRVIELVKQDPALTPLLFSLQTSGEPWSSILTTLSKTPRTPE